jgi:hypothetical protein
MGAERWFCVNGANVFDLLAPWTWILGVSLSTWSQGMACVGHLGFEWIAERI